MKQSIHLTAVRLRAGLIAVIAVLSLGLFAPHILSAQNATRSVEGKVYAGAAVQSGAVVYLQDTKTNNIKSFISTQDGSYRFGQLSTDVDYQVWADLKGKKSDKKTVSSFDSKKQLVIDLHLKD